jgi:Xaa-Pro aminopeptidase
LAIERIKNLRQHFEHLHIDGILISQPENRKYLSKFSGSDGWLFITGGSACLAVDSRYTEQARNETSAFEIVHIKGELQSWLPAIVSDLTITNLGFEASDISYATYKKLRESLSTGKYNVTLVPTTNVIESLRSIKDREEIAYILRAVQLVDSAMEYAQSIISPGKTERHIAWELEKYLREEGSQTVPFEIIVASGPNSALPHALPTERIIQNDEPVIVDMGARTNGYCSDITRTFCINENNTMYAKIYDIVLASQLAAINMIVPGTNGHQADLFARTVIEKAGYGENFGHGLGHGTGLNVHEAPRIGPRSSDILVDEMVFTLEPGIYIPGWGGVRIEDTVMFNNGKILSLTRSNK